MINDKQRILVVDDERFNLDVLVELLKDEYKIIVAKNGEQAIKAAKTMDPDLILLDIMMPEMDGFEVCQALKADEDSKDIPILFISALDNASEKIHGLELGAFDYITKPFQPEEVKARVKTHLKLYYLQRHLTDMVEQRTRQLARANALLVDLSRVKNEFLHIISHQLRTPANGILGLSEMILDLCPDSERKNDIVQAYQHSRDRMLKLLDHTLMLCDLEDSRESFEAASAMIICEALEQKGVKVKSVCDKKIDVSLNASREVLTHLVFELVEIADTICEDYCVNVHLEDDGIVVLTMHLTGLKVSESGLQAMFSDEADEHNASSGETLGLSPLVVLKIVEVLNGVVSTSINQDGLGEILLCLPVVIDGGRP